MVAIFRKFFLRIFSFFFCLFTCAVFLSIFVIACNGEKNENDTSLDGEVEQMEIEIPQEINIDEEEEIHSVEDSYDVLKDNNAEEEEVVVTPCGNGKIDTGEECDDGNNRTEFCGRWGDCLGDCSLLESNCGNGRLDPGEECDDGNMDNLDYCTTSCNINDHGIGAPCVCDTCFGINVTGEKPEDIHGCEGVRIPEGSGGKLACVSSLLEEYSGYRFFAPGGYCTVYAMKCLGSEMDCAELPDVGDVDNFVCPEGYPFFGVECYAVGGLGIRLKACIKPCYYSPSECRWNEWDSNLGECGHQDCIPLWNDPQRKVCFDERNYMVNLPGINCTLLLE